MAGFSKWFCEDVPFPVMLFERESPPLPSTAFHSPKWHGSRTHTLRTRAIIIVGVVMLMITSVGLLQHYSSENETPSATSDLHGLKSLQEIDSLSLKQQERFGSLRKPRDSREAPTDTSRHLPDEEVLADDIPSAFLTSEPVLANATLDFGKIYVLNLETREDRHDEMAFIAAASGLQLSFVAGVNSKVLEKQSLPDVYGTPQVILEPAHLACYRGHANIWRKMVEDGVETALIMEDDIDWDLNIREIMPRIKKALGEITKEPNPLSNTPGTCFLGNIVNSSVGYIILGDLL